MTIAPYTCALGLTIAVEVPTVALFYPGQRLRLGTCCCLVTTLTHATIFLVLFRFLDFVAAALVLGETGAILAEAGAYAVVSRPHDFPQALMASAAANALSFGLGLAVL
ncbi:MAG: hypothetical protein HY907_00475 [Deltaproteobacteria bacterium]|nr:hypothetical protein [Deltaproteobacteria bacterium]